MERDFGEHQEKLIKFIAALAKTNSKTLWGTVIESILNLLDADGCSIYLVPERVGEYSGELLDELGKPVYAEEIREKIVVLAATTRQDMQSRIGKAFYVSGFGLAGWVFQEGKTLRVNDCRDTQELMRLDPVLRWSNRYHGSEFYYKDKNQKVAVLIAPIKVWDENHLLEIPIGVIKIPVKKDRTPFSDRDQGMLEVAAQLVGLAVRRTWLTQLRQNEVLELMTTATSARRDVLFAEVTKQIHDSFNRSGCKLYMRSKDGSLISLTYEDGRKVEGKSIKRFRPGEGLVGWVYRTGRPLVLPDIREYKEGKQLSDAMLSVISDGKPVDEDCRFLQVQDTRAAESDRRIPFIAVPIKASDGEVHGVLCITSSRGVITNRDEPFLHGDWKRLEAFASTVLIAMESERARVQSDLLTEMGRTKNPDELINLVVNLVPKLICGCGCNFYQMIGDKLHLLKSTTRGLDPASVGEKPTYQIGQGKTGLCAQAQVSLTVNHFGGGSVSRKVMEEEKARITRENQHAVVEPLLDEAGQEVGLWVLGGEKKPPAIRQVLHETAASLRLLKGKGINTPHALRYDLLNSPFCYSFLGVPIVLENGELYGVITIHRPVEQTPYPPDDVALLESIANQLASVLSVFKLAQEKQDLIIQMAHSIHNPLNGMKYELTELANILVADAERQEMARRSLELLQRLHLTTTTYLKVLSGKKESVDFNRHNLSKPINLARSMFQGEARERWISIERPVMESGEAFPDIDMSLTDLENAFKNLLGNAVKYTTHLGFRPEQMLLVKILCGWHNDEKTEVYVKISNYGPGINQEEIASGKIFKPFYRGVRTSYLNRPGAGMGLANVWQVVVELHHGQVLAESSPYNVKSFQTTFTVILPVDPLAVELTARDRRI